MIYVQICSRLLPQHYIKDEDKNYNNHMFMDNRKCYGLIYMYNSNIHLLYEKKPDENV